MLSSPVTHCMSKHTVWHIVYICLVCMTFLCLFAYISYTSAKVNWSNLAFWKGKINSQTFAIAMKTHIKIK